MKRKKFFWGHFSFEILRFTSQEEEIFDLGFFFREIFFAWFFPHFAWVSKIFEKNFFTFFFQNFSKILKTSFAEFWAEKRWKMEKPLLQNFCFFFISLFFFLFSRKKFFILRRFSFELILQSSSSLRLLKSIFLFEK